MTAPVSSQKPPQVFVSHASEDKERFVLDFATKLRGNGIDAWLDKWEIGPGDSLVDKIFEEGLKNAEAVIVILSKVSVTKKWVREELNAGVVKRISGASKLIPIVIDDCEVPEALKSTVWVRVKDTNAYDTELQQVVMAVYGHQDKPPLGKAPQYAQTRIEVVSGLLQVDSLVLKLACDEELESDRTMIQTESVVQRAKALDIPEDEVADSLHILDNRGYIDGKSPTRNGAIRLFTITPYGFNEYGKVYLPGYGDLLTSVAARIVNAGAETNHAIVAAIQQPRILVDYALDVWASAGMIKVIKFMGTERPARVTYISPELKRRLQ